MREKVRIKKKRREWRRRKKKSERRKRRKGEGKCVRECLFDGDGSEYWCREVEPALTQENLLQWKIGSGVQSVLNVGFCS